MQKENTPSPLEVAVRDLTSKVDLYLKQGCLRTQLYKANEAVKRILDSPTP
jgi:hypothetical protein